MTFFDAVFDAMLAKARELYIGKTIKFLDRYSYSWRIIKCANIEIIDTGNESWMIITDDQDTKYLCTGFSGDDYNVMLAEIIIIND